MNDLFRLLSEFTDALDEQRRLTDELMPLLDAEEQSLASYKIADFERVITEKEQLARRIARQETKRDAALAKLCFLISFDARQRTPSLRVFLQAFGRYVENTRSLLDEETWSRLASAWERLRESAHAFEEFFAASEPRILRNRAVMRKMLKNVEHSIALFQTEFGLTQAYDRDGRTGLTLSKAGVKGSSAGSTRGSPGPSSFRVKA